MTEMVQHHADCPSCRCSDARLATPASPKMHYHGDTMRDAVVECREDHTPASGEAGLREALERLVRASEAMAQRGQELHEAGILNDDKRHSTWHQMEGEFTGLNIALIEYRTALAAVATPAPAEPPRPENPVAKGIREIRAAIRGEPER